MPDFYHAGTCRCGNCQLEPADGPTTGQQPCGCIFSDGEMYFCPGHDPDQPAPEPAAW